MFQKAKNLAEECSELGLERLSELEQALALCKELDSSYIELNDWMDGVEEERRNCEPITTGMSPKELMQQQTHNNVCLCGFSYFHNVRQREMKSLNVKCYQP